MVPGLGMFLVALRAHAVHRVDVVHGEARLQRVRQLDAAAVVGHALVAVGARSRVLGPLGLIGLHVAQHAAIRAPHRQRVAVVRALVNAPGLVLADEPTGSLDRATAAELSSLLVDINREEGVALVTVTHSEALAGRMGRVLVLRDGKLADARVDA